MLIIAPLCGCDVKEDSASERATFPTQGVVLLRGKPIEDAFVSLRPVVRPDDNLPLVLPRAKTDAEGRFALSTYVTHDGAPAGEYQVAFSWGGPLQGLDEEEQDDLKERLDPRYQQPGTSGILVTITEGDNALPPMDLQ